MKRQSSRDVVFEVMNLMALVSFGSQKGDRPSTPTLRQYHKRTGKSPKQSHVKIIFLPGKLPYYTLVTDHDFKVVIQEDNPLHQVVKEQIAAWEADKACLVVVITNGEKGEWELSCDTNDNSEYEPKSWGYVLSGYGKKTPTKTHH